MTFIISFSILLIITIPIILIYLLAKDCKVSKWSEYSKCSANCDGGIQTRTRKIKRNGLAGGNKCPILIEEKKCNEQVCDIDCVVSEWPSYGVCSKPCEGGTQTRIRQIITPKKGKGKECPILEEAQKCNEQECPYDANVYEKCAPDETDKDRLCSRKVCPIDTIDFNGSCFSKCPTDYINKDDKCIEKCKNGYRDDGINCIALKPPVDVGNSYSRGVGKSLSIVCPADHEIKGTVGNQWCEKNGVKLDMSQVTYGCTPLESSVGTLCYMNCGEGYTANQTNCIKTNQDYVKKIISNASTNKIEVTRKKNKL